MKKKLSRVLIAGTNSGCGKTTMVCALLQALVNRGEAVASFKCGPDYIDPMFHSSIIGARSRNLDLFMLGGDTARYLLLRNGENCRVSVVEGVMGFYDGVGMTTEASSYALAKATETPVILVVNASGAAHSVLATISGYAGLYPDSGVAGVILNGCSGMLYPRLKELILAHFHGAIRPLGYMPKMPDCALESRHLGLVTAQEVTDLRGKLQRMAEQAEKSLDIPGILALADEAVPLEYEPPRLPGKGERVRVAVARDAAFCFYYEDSLRLLEELGAELVPFSPLSDRDLPENIQGLYLGGGYPELYAKPLSENSSMLRAIRAYLEAGRPCVAECGGFLYLHEELEGYAQVGYLKGRAVNRGKLVRFGYTTMTAKEDNLLCRKGETLRAHEFHYYDVDDPGSAFVAEKSSGAKWDCGVCSGTLYAGFPHFHMYSHPQMAANFLEACRKELI